MRALPLVLLFALPAAAEPVPAGLKPGQRPGPYSSLVAVGRERGQAHCYVCESATKPVAIVFARSLSEPLGKLAKKLDAALTTHKAVELRAWVTLLADDQAAADPRAVAWARQHALGTLPVGVFEDLVGPPAYLLARDADVTVLLSHKQRVVAAFAYRGGELNDAAITEIIQSLSRMVEKK